MLSKLLRFAAPLVALALFAMAPPKASAVSVTFTTSGGFTSASGAPVTVYGSGGDAVTVTYAPQLAGTGNTPFGTDLGSFSTTGGSLNTVGPVSDSFTLTVTQIAPPNTPPTGNLSANVTGTISINSGVLAIDFTSPSVTIGPVTYTLDSTHMVLPVPSIPGGKTTVNATITAVPLPATANMGIALLVCLAGAGVWRKLKSSQAVA
jgi:hypothetical protein